MGRMLGLRDSMEIRPTIKVHNRTTGEKNIYRMDQDRLTAGRDAGNYIVLNANTVSRRHAEFSHENGQYFIRDLKSNNGTRLNGTPLSPEDRILLRMGDIIQIEDFDLQFQAQNPESKEEVSEITDADLLEVKMVKKLLRTLDKASAPSIESIDGPEKGKRFILDEKNQDILIGRDPACEFVIDSNVVSRKHVRIEKRFDSVTVHDLESKNGVFVNREKVATKKLQDGDILHLGTLAFVFRNPLELSFDLEPPRTKPEPAPTPSPSPPPVQPPVAQGSSSRAARRKGTSDPMETDEPSLSQSMRSALLLSGGLPEEENPESPQSDPAENASSPESSIGLMEIIAIIVGGIVLLGSIWGILRLLK